MRVEYVDILMELILFFFKPKVQRALKIKTNVNVP